MRRWIVVLLLVLAGCNITIPITDDARKRDSIGSYWMYEVGLHWTEDTAIQAGGYHFNKYGSPFKIYTLEELDAVLEDWEGWNIPYDRNLRKCTEFANALRTYGRFMLPGIALGVIHIDYKFQLYGHAAGLFVECDTSSGMDWFTDERNYTTWIVNFRHGADLTRIIGVKYESFDMQRWQIRFIDL